MTAAECLFQTELAINTHTVISDVRQDVANTRAVVTDVRNDVKATHDIVSNATTTSKTHTPQYLPLTPSFEHSSGVSDTHTIVSIFSKRCKHPVYCHRHPSQPCEEAGRGADGKNQPVSVRVLVCTE